LDFFGDFTQCDSLGWHKLGRWPWGSWFEESLHSKIKPQQSSIVIPSHIGAFWSLGLIYD
jgi:hypothetical protein